MKRKTSGSHATSRSRKVKRAVSAHTTNRLKKYSKKLKRSFNGPKKKVGKRFVANDLHSGLTSTNYNSITVNKPVKGLFPKGGSQRYMEQYSYRLLSNAGQQVVYELIQMGTVNQWMTGVGGATSLGVSPQFSYLNYFSLNPSRGLTGSDWYNVAAANARPAMDRYAYVNSELMIEMTSFSSAAASLDFYFWKSKVDNAATPGVIWQQADSTESLGVAAAAGNAPGTFVGTAVTGYQNISTANAKPYHFPAVSKQWKLVKVHHVDLAAAASEVLKIDIKMNQLGAIDRFIAVNQTFGMTQDPATWLTANVKMGYPKGCLVCMIVAKGQVIDDKTTANVHVPTFASVDVGFVITKSNKFKPVYASTAARINTALVYPQIPYNTALINQEIINYTDQAAVIQAL